MFKIEDSINKLLEEKKYSTIRDILVLMAPSDLAAIFELIEEKNIPLVFRLLPKDKADDTFVEMENEYQELLIKSFTDSELKAILDEMYVNDVADLVEEMPANVVSRILKNVDSETRKDINLILQYPENSAGSLMTTEYVLFMNDDMYVCPGWDTALDEEITAIGHNRFFLSATLIQPRPFFCKSVIAPADYGQTVESFDEERLLKEYQELKHDDWQGATWPPNVVHRDMWDLVGGYSIEYSPGMYSDPDFSAKLWKAGVRLFKGVSRSRVYHFEARSTHRIIKNDGSTQFLRKWGITSASFIRDVLHRGEKWNGQLDAPSSRLKADLLRSRLKRLLTIFRDVRIKNIWED